MGFLVNQLFTFKSLLLVIFTIKLYLRLYYTQAGDSYEHD